MLNPRTNRSAAAALAVSAAAIAAATALASPIVGVITPTNFVTANYDETALVNSDRVKLQTKGRTDVRVQQLVFDPGSATGWHHHPGAVIVAVQSGALTLTDSNCGTKTYGPGQPNGEVFVEGHADAHQASSAGGAVIFVTYIAPSAEPRVFRVEDDEPACAAAQ